MDRHEHRNLEDTGGTCPTTCLAMNIMIRSLQHTWRNASEIIHLYKATDVLCHVLLTRPMIISLPMINHLPYAYNFMSMA